MKMLLHSQLSASALQKKIRKGEIVLAGNAKLKIYGLLSCAKGKRLRKDNRVFFYSEQEAITLEYRPCGHCMKDKYHSWKNGSVQ